MATIVKENFTIFGLFVWLFDLLPRSTDIAIPGYYLHFQHWDAMTSETYSNYNHLTKQLMLININALKRFQSYFYLYKPPFSGRFRPVIKRLVR